MKATLKASGAISGSQTFVGEDQAQEQLVETDIAMEKEVEGDENIRTARRSQQHREELLAVSKNETVKKLTEVDIGDTYRNENMYDDSMHTTNETKMAQVSHSIDVGQPRNRQYDLSPVNEQ